MRLVQALLGLTIVAWLVCFSASSRKGGYYSIVVQKLYPCEDQGTNKAKFNISSYPGPPDDAGNRKMLYSGSFSWYWVRDADMELAVDIYYKNSSDYFLIEEVRDETCNVISRAVYLYANVLDAIGVSNGDNCPIPAEDYNFIDWDVQFQMTAFILDYGPYKAKIRFLAEKEVYGCVVMEFDLVPREYTHKRDD